MIFPLISIIIPTYNRAHLIGETLDSVLAQTYTNWECIIVDDGSTDDTEALIQTYIQKDTRFQYFKRPKDRPKGPSACRNYGFEMSNGEYINWFDSDDVMLENFLQKKIEPFQKDKSLDIVFSAFTYFDEYGIQKRISNTNFSGNIITDMVEGHVTFGPLSFLVIKSALKNHKFNESLFRSEDLDFFFRIFTYKKPKIHYVPDVLHRVRKHQGDTVSASNDELGLRILSEYEVNAYILEEMLKLNNKKGIEKFKVLVLKNIKNLIEQTYYKITLKNIFKANYLSTKQKVFLYFIIIFYRITGRGLYKIIKV